MRYCMIMALMLWMISPYATAEEVILNPGQAAESGTFNLSSVDTVLPVKHDFFLLISWFGQVMPMQSVTLPAQITGTVVSLEADDGASVRAGDLLFVLGGREVESRRADLHTRLQSAQQGLKTAQQSFKIRQSMLNAHLSSKDLLNAARQAVVQTTAQLSTIRQAATAFDTFTSVRAPINGVFTARAVNVEQYVSVGAVLAHIVNPDHVRIQASLFPPPGVSLQGLQTVIGGTGLSGEQGWHATVRRVFPDANAAGAVQVWIEGDELAGLIPGTPVSGELKSISHLALSLPDSAIARNEQGEAFVFIRTPQGFRRQPVQTGLVDHDQVEIISGLSEGERVVSKGAYELLYGDFSTIYREPD